MEACNLILIKLSAEKEEKESTKSNH
jgi:hypothetical protein